MDKVKSYLLKYAASANIAAVPDSVDEKGPLAANPGGPERPDQ